MSERTIKNADGQLVAIDEDGEILDGVVVSVHVSILMARTMDENLHGLAERAGFREMENIGWEAVGLVGQYLKIRVWGNLTEHLRDLDDDAPGGARDMEEAALDALEERAREQMGMDDEEDDLLEDDDE